MGKRQERRPRGRPAGGIDPSAFVSSQPDRRAERKTRQLCREVRDALSIALGELADDALAGVWVAEVVSDDASHLRVIVVAGPGADVDRVHEALQRASARLRGEVAQAIARKRTPLLGFEVHVEDTR
jgi:ribosome-binding factor A